MDKDKLNIELENEEVIDKIKTDLDMDNLTPEERADRELYRRLYEIDPKIAEKFLKQSVKEDTYQGESRYRRRERDSAINPVDHIESALRRIGELNNPTNKKEKDEASTRETSEDVEVANSATGSKEISEREKIINGGIDIREIIAKASEVAREKIEGREDKPKSEIKSKKGSIVETSKDEDKPKAKIKSKKGSIEETSKDEDKTKAEVKIAVDEELMARIKEANAGNTTVQSNKLGIKARLSEYINTLMNTAKSSKIQTSKENESSNTSGELLKKYDLKLDDENNQRFTESIEEKNKMENLQEDKDQKVESTETNKTDSKISDNNEKTNNKSRKRQLDKVRRQLQKDNGDKKKFTGSRKDKKKIKRSDKDKKIKVEAPIIPKPTIKATDEFIAIRPEENENKYKKVTVLKGKILDKIKAIKENMQNKEIISKRGIAIAGAIGFCMIAISSSGINLINNSEPEIRGYASEKEVALDSDELIIKNFDYIEKVDASENSNEKNTNKASSQSTNNMNRMKQKEDTNKREESKEGTIREEESKEEINADRNENKNFSETIKVGSEINIEAGRYFETPEGTGDYGHFENHQEGRKIISKIGIATRDGYISITSGDMDLNQLKEMFPNAKYSYHIVEEKDGKQTTTLGWLTEESFEQELEQDNSKTFEEEER